MKSWEINGKAIGWEPYIVAEIGINHNGDEKLAVAMIEAAAAAGADAVKFQLFDAEKLVSSNNNEDLVDFFKRFELSRDSYRRLFRHCRESGITFLATPFDIDNADFLAELGVKAYKIASGDLTYIQLIEHVAALGKPILLSTGMATLQEVAEAVQAIQETGNFNILLFHCTSAYPCPPGEVNLNNLITLRNTFGLPVGLSDHTQGNLAALSAGTMGVAMIEKHFTSDRDLPGPDQELSMTPSELSSLVKDLATIYMMRGSYKKAPTTSERATRQAARRSIFASAPLAPGTVIEKDMLAYQRPGTGLTPSHADLLIGCTVRDQINEGELITWDKVLQPDEPA